MTATQTVVAEKAQPGPEDAIALLEADHEAVSQLFAVYEKTRSMPDKKALVAEICTALSVHAQIKEEIFYPAVMDVLKHKRLLPLATVAHAGVKDLIAQLAGVDPDGEMYDAKVKVLSDHVQHYVKEEHNEMFPKAKASALDMVELGSRMAARKDDLLARAS